MRAILDSATPFNLTVENTGVSVEIELETRADGLRTAVVRSRTCTGASRTTPIASCRPSPGSGAEGGVLRVDGPSRVFDFTHRVDVVRGLLALAERLSTEGAPLPPIHLTSGRGTTLGQLARMAARAGSARARIVEAPPRSYDVARFIGDPSRAYRLLDWRAERSIDAGIGELVRAFAAQRATSGNEKVA